MKLAIVLFVGAALLWVVLAQIIQPVSADPKIGGADLGANAMNTRKATFAAGCFWGVEATFRKMDGVVATAVGYAGGHTNDPTYRAVCTDTTGHAESVEVTYDPAKVSYAELLDAFWSCHDPTTMNRQGPDVGTQYRSVIFFHDAEQEKLARASMKEVQDSGVFRGKIVTQITAAGKFFSAEDYHQRYFEKQGLAESCHVGVAEVHTKLAEQATAERKAAATTRPAEVPAKVGAAPTKWKAPTDAELKARLTPEQYEIARHAGTEQAFTGKYWDEHRAGTYKCAVCGQELFKSDTKFDSGTGWPSFFKPISKDAVSERTDTAHGMKRTEVVCSRCQSHLGHVFDDGPAPTGLRYCMNSAVLELVATE